MRDAAPPRSERFEPLRVLAREADAMRRQSALLAGGVARRGVQLSARGEAEDVVFFVHGVLATAGVFSPIERALRRAGVAHFASFSYHPWRSIASLVQELKREVRAIPGRARVHLVGHSLGGIVARAYVHEAGGHARVAQTISLASPFHGTALARIARAGVVRELRPDSELLARLRSPLGQPRVRHTSFVAADDLVIQPAMSAAFPHGEVIVVERAGHNGLLFDPSVAEAIARRVRAFEPARPAA
ncbi:MAG: alpha/beta fold hydrolase [Polyangiaceae bacterium]|nr:alpha/beta fold hydrolase [Polyangiaceae bacterium]